MPASSTFSETPPEQTFQNLQNFLMMRGATGKEEIPRFVSWLESEANQGLLRNWIVDSFRPPHDGPAFAAWRNQLGRLLTGIVEQESQSRAQQERELTAALDALYKQVEAARGDVIAAKPKGPGEDKLAFINNLDLEATRGVHRWLQKKAVRKILAWYGHVNYRNLKRANSRAQPAEWSQEPVPEVVRKMVPLAASTSDQRKQAERRKLLTEFRRQANIARRLREAIPLRLIVRKEPLRSAQRVLQAAAVRVDANGNYAWSDGRFPVPDELARVARLAEALRGSDFAPRFRQLVEREMNAASEELTRLFKRAPFEQEIQKLLVREPSAYLFAFRPTSERLGEIWALLTEKERNTAVASLALEAERHAKALEETGFWKVGQKRALEMKKQACEYALAQILLHDIHGAHVDRAIGRVQFAVDHKVLSDDARPKIIAAIQGMKEGALSSSAKASILTMLGAARASEDEMQSQDALAEIERNAETVSTLREISDRLPEP